MDFIKAISTILQLNDRVTEITVERATIEKEPVDGWPVKEPADELRFSFTYKDKNDEEELEV